MKNEEKAGDAPTEDNSTAVAGKLKYSISVNSKGEEKSRKVVQSVRNYEIVLQEDPRFAEKIRFNEFSNQTMLVGSVAWDTDNEVRSWSARDDSEVFSIIQDEYGLRGRNDFFDALRNVSNRNRYHPVRNRLDSLQWDHEDHIKNLLPEYLGAEVSPYNEAVMRHAMLGAVARIYDPGCKFDDCPVFQGGQGLGKSTFWRRMALCDEWFTDSLDSLDGDKAVQLLTGSWIVELAELKSLARTSGGMDSVKRFLSAQQDKIRLPYERRAETFQRSCVFVGTTNKMEFLDDDTGNRRFLVCYVGVNKPTKDIFSDDALKDIEQAWAQAVYIWKMTSRNLFFRRSIESRQNRCGRPLGRTTACEESSKSSYRIRNERVRLKFGEMRLKRKASYQDGKQRKLTILWRVSQVGNE